MQTKFRAAMAKVATLGKKRSSLVDCSDVIPIPKALTGEGPHLPAGKSLTDIDASMGGILKKFLEHALSTTSELDMESAKLRRSRP